MSSFWTASIRLGAFFLFSSLMIVEIPAPAQAAKPTHQQAMAACRAKYGKKVTNAVVNKNGSITCQSRVVRQMTRAEVFEACKKKYGATTIIVQKKGNGWLCRYYGRY
jgi:hypothetical protein